MNDKEKEEKLKERVKQLEEYINKQQWLLPPKPDPNLAEDEWYAIFSNWQDTTTGTITKIPWSGGANSTAVYKVKRIS